MASESDGSFGAAAAESAAGVDVKDKSLPSMRLRQFDGDRDGYEEWKKEVEAVELLYKVPEERLAPLIFLALAPAPGKPRDLLSHLDVKTEICAAGGLQKVWGILDKEYIKQDFVKSDEAQTKYDKLTRKTFQGMQEYLRELRIARRRLEKADAGSTISEVSMRARC